MSRLARVIVFAGLLAAGAGPTAIAAPPPGPGLHLAFETLDDRVQGNGWLVAGVTGQALQLDGIAAHLTVGAADVPRLAGSFVVEGWVALGAYPFNDAPLLQQQDGESAGFFLGLGDRGQARFDVAAGGRRLSVVSPTFLALRQWAHVAGVFEEGKGATLYVNGEAKGFAASTAGFAQAKDSDLWIGRNAYAMEQSAPVGSGRQQPARILLDGILDELRISLGVRSASEIRAQYARQRPTNPPPLPARSLPKLPAGPSSFGAFYTRLSYYKGWDDSWRTGDEPDAVVRFDQAPYWFAF